MYKKSFLLLSLVALLSGLFIGCGEEKAKDPYATVTLSQATYGKVVSKGFKYKLDNPKIEVLANHIGLVREGNLLEVISGRSLEDKMEGLEGKSFTLNVIKEFSPYVHYRVEQINTETDTIFISQAGTISYPNIKRGEFQKGEYEDYNLTRIPYNRTATIKAVLNKPMYVTGTVTMEEEDGNPTFWLNAENGSKFRITEPGTGTTLVMKMLVNGNYTFEGGIIMTEVENWASRKATKIIANIEVQFVKYGDAIISG